MIICEIKNKEINKGNKVKERKQKRRKMLFVLPKMFREKGLGMR